MKARHRNIVDWARATAQVNAVGKMPLAEALSFARDLKYGPLPKPSDPTPSLDEAIDEIKDFVHTCGYNSLTAAAAIATLADAS